MNPTLYAARLGLSRGWAEFRQSLTDPQQLGSQVFFAVAFVIVLLFQRDSTVEGTNVSLAFAVLPGILGMMVAIGGLQGAAGRRQVGPGRAVLDATANRYPAPNRGAGQADA